MQQTQQQVLLFGTLSVQEQQACTPSRQAQQVWPMLLCWGPRRLGLGLGQCSRQ